MSKQSPIFLRNSPTFMLITALLWHHCEKLTPSGQEANNIHPGFFLLMSVCVAMTAHLHRFECASACACIRRLWYYL